jgi:hypothetical protein
VRDGRSASTTDTRPRPPSLTAEGDLTHIAWLCGAAPAFDTAACDWLSEQGVKLLRLQMMPRPRYYLPVLTRTLRVRSYLRRLEPATHLVLPYLAGDCLLLSYAGRLRTLGAALGSDLLQPRLNARQERTLARAIARFDAIWAVSEALSAELVAFGRSADWHQPIGVDLKRLPPSDARQREKGRIFSARNDDPFYRRTWIRSAADGIPGASVVEPHSWPLERMFEEFTTAEIVVSLPATDGAPATLMEALCCGSHVVASGGSTVREWIRRFGGTYGEPQTVDETRGLMELGMRRARAETPSQQRERALAGRQVFDRDVTLRPLLGWLRQVPPEAARIRTR